MEFLWEKIKEFKLYFAIVGVFLLIGGGVFIFRREPPEEMAKTEFSQLLTEETTVTTTMTESSEIYIDVKGAVGSPGMYKISSDSRLIEAVDLAGGFTAEADQTQLNFALKLVDQQVIYVPKIGEEIPAGLSENQTSIGQETADDSKVNINTADATELQTLSGIGEKKAQDIINYRETNGSFTAVEDLLNVSGIGEKTLEKLKDQITV